MSATQRGVSPGLMTREQRENAGLVIWETGGIFRPGKTKRDIEGGAKRNAALNRAARRDVPGRYVAGEKVDEKYVHTNKRGR